MHATELNNTALHETKRRRLTRLLERWTVVHELGLVEGIFEHRTYVPEQPLFVLRNARPHSPRQF